MRTRKNRRVLTAHLPTIKFSNGLWALSIEDLDQMSEHGLPNTQLKFVHEIHDEQGEDGHKCTLWYDQL